MLAVPKVRDFEYYSYTQILWHSREETSSAVGELQQQHPPEEEAELRRLRPWSCDPHASAEHNFYGGVSGQIDFGNSTFWVNVFPHRNTDRRFKTRSYTACSSVLTSPLDCRRPVLKKLTIPGGVQGSQRLHVRFSHQALLLLIHLIAQLGNA